MKIVGIKKISKVKIVWLKLNCLNSRYNAGPSHRGACNDYRPQEYSLFSFKGKKRDQTILPSALLGREQVSNGEPKQSITRRRMKVIELAKGGVIPMREESYLRTGNLTIRNSSSPVRG